MPVEIRISGAFDDLPDEQITDVRLRKPRAWREQQCQYVHTAEQLVDRPRGLVSGNSPVLFGIGAVIWQARRMLQKMTKRMPSLRRAIDDVDPQLALAQVRTLQDTLDLASAQMAFMMILLAIAAGVALTLGVIGIYGVMSYIVTQRTGEIGVRLALGAEPASVARMIVRQGALVALAGIAIGLATALAGNRLIESLLYGVSSRDLGVFATTALMLLTVALFACWLPARRAARLDPLEALRAD
jgi:predicted lysophospholipase L1 biosynthesis ABC-type transport system permease subunit